MKSTWVKMFFNACKYVLGLRKTGSRSEQETVDFKDEFI